MQGTTQDFRRLSFPVWTRPVPHSYPIPTSPRCRRGRNWKGCVILKSFTSSFPHYLPRKLKTDLHKGNARDRIYKWKQWSFTTSNKISCPSTKIFESLPWTCGSQNPTDSLLFFRGNTQAKNHVAGRSLFVITCSLKMWFELINYIQLFLSFFRNDFILLKNLLSETTYVT